MTTVCIKRQRWIGPECFRGRCQNQSPKAQYLAATRRTSRIWQQSRGFQRVKDNTFHPWAARRLFWRDENQPRPARKETKTTDRSNWAEPTQTCERKQIQTSAKQQNPKDEQPARAAIYGSV